MARKPGLTEKQAVFVREYLVDLNGARAAREAGYSQKSAARYAIEMLNKPHVAETIRVAMQERNARVEISQDRIIEEVSLMAFGDTRDAIKLKALELLMRHKGMLNDKLALTGDLNISALEKGRERAKDRV